VTARSRSAVVGLGAGSVFLSALLIFLIEPILGRKLLPIYGGSAAVWNTSLMVFQLLLLIGYLYAHVISRVLSSARSRIAHALLLVASIAFLPPAIHAREASEGWPVASIVAALFGAIGLIFLLLSANTVITQKWLAELGVKNPFWLYAASNAGSLVALLAYPLVIEPLTGLNRQIRWWNGLYLLFIGVCITVMYLVGRGESSAERPQRVPLFGGVPGRRVGLWVLLSAVPSSLLMSTTLQVSNEAGAAPLFWVIPLAIYLATFVIAFSTWRVPGPFLYWGAVVGMALAFTIILTPIGLPLALFAAIAVGCLFFGSLFCHTILAASTPDADHLTSFYLWVAVGGFVGGAFNALLAPLLFSSVAEFPLTLLLVALLVARYGEPGSGDDGERANLFGRYAPVILPVVAIVTAVICVTLARRGLAQFPLYPRLFRWEMMPLAVMVFAVAFARNRQAFVAATLFSASFVLLDFHLTEPPIDQLRSFYGVARVTRTPIDVRLIHGATLHGTQSLYPDKRRRPTTYFHPDGPLGSVLRDLPRGSTVGIVGLGAGSLAALGKPEQRMYFFEIDPAIVEMASRHFSYVQDSPARVFFALGDGRKQIEEMGELRFDVLMIDAFSGDAIPTHLLTREAIDLYLSRVKPGGLVVFHISSRYANLPRVLRGWLRETGRPVAVSRFVPTRPQKLDGATPTIAAAIAPSPERLRTLIAGESRLWSYLSPHGEAVVWTDDSVNLLGVLRHPGR
jgi:hypothetical protein